MGSSHTRATPTQHTLTMLAKVLSLALIGAVAAAPTGDAFCDALSQAKHIYQPCNVVKYVAMQAQTAFPKIDAYTVIGIFEFGGKINDDGAQTDEEAFAMIQQLIANGSVKLPRNADNAAILAFA